MPNSEFTLLPVLHLSAFPLSQDSSNVAFTEIIRITHPVIIIIHINLCRCELTFLLLLTTHHNQGGWFSRRNSLTVFAQRRTHWGVKAGKTRSQKTQQKNTTLYVPPSPPKQLHNSVNIVRGKLGWNGSCYQRAGFFSGEHNAGCIPRHKRTPVVPPGGNEGQHRTVTSSIGIHIIKKERSNDKL